MESGLVKIHAAGLAFGSYLNELGAVLFHGSLPPVAEGFSRFLEGSETRAALDRATEEELRQDTFDPYESHPPLRQRLDALKNAPHKPALVPDPAAIELLRNEPILEVALLTQTARVDVSSLKPFGWDDVAAVWLGIWQKECQEERRALAEITPDMLPLVCQDPTVYKKADQAPQARGETARCALGCHRRGPRGRAVPTRMGAGRGSRRGRCCVKGRICDPPVRGDARPAGWTDHRRGLATDLRRGRNRQHRSPRCRHS